MSKRWILAAAVLLLAAGVTWYFTSPWYTLKQMRDAARENDADRFSAYIDYPAVREDLKAEIMAQVIAEAQKDKSGYGSLGTAFASATVGPLVDGIVSPAGLRAAFIANRNKRAKRPKNQAAGAFQLADDAEVKRRSFDEFAVGSKSRNKGEMIFKRHGLGWKLSGVDLPLSK
jgi:hypothetical protein